MAGTSLFSAFCLEIYFEQFDFNILSFIQYFKR